jgi:hypothetical protein
MSFKKTYALVGTNLKYGAHLEFNGWPWLSTAVAQTSKSVGETFAKNLQKAIKNLQGAK